MLETGDHTSRTRTIRLLLLFDDIKGKQTTKTLLTELLSQIVLCAAEESEPSQIRTYLAQLDTLLAYSTPSAKPDYRWLLYLYCHAPSTVFEWAKLPAGQIPTAIASPSRLVEWVVASWNAWKEESLKGGEGTDERLAIRELGVRMTRTAVAQVGVSTCFVGANSTAADRWRVV